MISLKVVLDYVTDPSYGSPNGIEREVSELPDSLLVALSNACTKERMARINAKNNAKGVDKA